MSEEPMILHASDEVLGMMGVSKLNERIAELERERNEARALAALFVVGMVSDQDTLGATKARAAAITSALTLAERALGEVEYRAVVSGRVILRYECEWCGGVQNSRMPHSPDCARQAALSAIRSVRQ